MSKYWRELENQPAPTLHLTRGCGKTLALALLLVGVLWGAAEGSLRLLAGLGAVQPPGPGSLNAELDIKLPLLDRMAARGGIDCLFFGSSQFDSAADPEVFARAYAQITGRAITCFNFSLGTLTAQPAGKLAGILLRRYHPRLLIFGTSARDYSRNFGELTRPLLANAWVRAQLGQPNFEGWLVEHSLAYRALLAARGWTQWEYRLVLRRMANDLTGSGFLSLGGNNLKNEDSNFIPEYVRSGEDMRGLEELLRLNGPAVQVIVVEVPVHASFLDHYVQASPADYRRLFQQPIRQVVSERGVPFWQSQEEMQARISDSGWADVKHLNASGAAVYSTWLAEQLARAEARGEVHLPQP